MAVAFKHRSLPGPTSGICVVKRWEQSRCFFFQVSFLLLEIAERYLVLALYQLSSSLPIDILLEVSCSSNTAFMLYPGSTCSKACSVLGDKKK